MESAERLVILGVQWLKLAVETTGAIIVGLGFLIAAVQFVRAAVEAAITEKWSNGPTEGHVNRLKFIKRQGYDRAGFDLLKARVLPLAA